MKRTMATRFTRAAKRLHDDEGGLVVVLFVLVAIIFAILIALNWNTGRIVSAKMRAQAAADQGALAAATWQSRAVNLITGTNMLILRNASAEVSARASMAVVNGVRHEWQAALDACGDAPGGPCAQEIIRRIIRDPDNEIGPYIRFVGQTGQYANVAIENGVFTRRIAELHEFQRRLIESIPEVVEEQRGMIEAFHNVELILAVPGRSDGLIVPPLRRGDAASFERMLRLRRQLSDNWLPDAAEFGRFSAIGRARQIWDQAEEEAIVSISTEYGSFHYVLETQVGADEISPSAGGRGAFSVFATAVVPEVREDNFLFKGFFDYEISPADTATAAAQAETFNGYDERFARRNAVAAWPFRVWTLWGWNWQPRLTRSDLARATLESDPDTRAAWLGAGIEEMNYDSVGFGLQH
ncbi:MAG: hypothetical protein JNK58_08205 [Phycisphaerae bacterium]|nr:hypothetical protein [Phycisphaerae bacterium]